MAQKNPDYICVKVRSVNLAQISCVYMLNTNKVSCPHESLQTLTLGVRDIKQVAAGMKLLCQVQLFSYLVI